MHHPAELALHQYLDNATKGKSSMSKETIKQVSKDIEETLSRQFGSRTKRDKFKLRMSNVGRPSCQLWFEKNKPEKALPRPTTFVMNMMIGDIIEAIFKGLLKEAGVKYKNSDKVKLDLDGTQIEGTYDLVINDAVDDIKSASNWSYINKFDSFEKLKESDGFGYIAQLAGYAKASNKKAGGWWVVNKANGDFKYVPATSLDIEQECTNIKNTISKIEDNKFERCFEPIDETFRGKPTGNKILNDGCIFCAFRYECWESLQDLPSLVSQAQTKKIVPYISIKERSK
tara:strand:+ start:1675 stop:2532 length:858 start_codon:yes stop_codon:yes gene_type:complete